MSDRRTNASDFEQWVVRLTEANFDQRRATWAVIDLLLEGHDRWEDRFWHMADGFGYAEQTIKNYLTIGRQWPKNIRLEHLSPNLHACFNTLTSTADKD